MSDPAEKTAEPQIRIISRAHDGFRRGGIAHPADATYPVSAFTEAQMVQIIDEPLLTVVVDGATDEDLAKASARAKSKK